LQSIIKELLVDSFQLPANNENFPKLRELAKGFCAQENINSDVTCRLLVVLEELFINTIQHGYRNAEGMARIELKQTPGYISIVYEDAAPAFDPFKKALADPGVSVNNGKVGGMGLVLIHKMADSLTHERRGEWNRTTILMKSS